MFLVHHWEVMITYLQEMIDSITRAAISGFFSNSIYDVILDRESYKVQEKESSQDNSIKEDDKQVKPEATIVK